jgi:uncharacterized surface protein with fasciclin (FAS1) repeats
MHDSKYIQCVIAGLIAIVLVPAGSAWAAKDIVDTAVEAGSFKTLVAAVKAAGLVDTLKGPGPLTVFAPSDEAFAKLPDGTLDDLLKPENKQKLVDILTYHVVAGRLTAADVSKAIKADTVQGASVLFSVDKSGVRVDGAKVVAADIEATNGVIHVIDAVILPKNIVERAASVGKFKTLLTAAKAAGLAGALSAADADLTVFAPTDTAFASLPPETLAELLLPENKDRLATILKFHVLPKRLLLGSSDEATLAAESVELRAAGKLTVEDARIVLADIKATNGVIHVIDRVLLPDLPAPTAVDKAIRVINKAINRGVPQFNAGNPEACAAIYEIAAESLLTGHAEALDEQSRKRLRKALKDIHNDHSARAKAWTLRYALDDVDRRLTAMKHAGN